MLNYASWINVTQSHQLNAGSTFKKCDSVQYFLVRTKPTQRTLVILTIKSVSSLHSCTWCFQGRLTLSFSALAFSQQDVWDNECYNTLLQGVCTLSTLMSCHSHMGLCAPDRAGCDPNESHRPNWLTLFSTPWASWRAKITDPYTSVQVSYDSVK